MKKAFKIALSAVGCLMLLTQRATAQAVPAEVEQFQEGRLIEAPPAPNLILHRNFDDRDLEFWRNAPIFQNEVPKGLGLTGCLDGAETDTPGIREARGWIDNGDGTFSMTDQVDMLCP